MILTCLFGHGDRFRERLEDGTYVFRCSACGDDQAILPNQAYPVKAIKPLKAKKVKKKRMERTCATEVVAALDLPHVRSFARRIVK